MSSALFLACSNLLCRLLGFVYKVPLANLIGAEGLGYYSFAFQVYGLIAAVVVSGLPIAMTRTVAASPIAQRPGILRRSLRLLLRIGLLGTVLLFLAARPAATLGGMPGAWIAVAALAPNILAVAIENGYRSYFQGINDLRSGAAAQIADAVIKLLTGTVAAWLLYRRGAPPAMVAAGALLGVWMGTVACVVWMHICARRQIKRQSRREQPPPGLEKELIRQAIPQTVGTVLLSAMHTADTMVLMNRLNCDNATALYGAYNGLTVTVYNLPFSVTSAIAATVLPVIASAKDNRRVRSCLRRAFRLSGAVAFPIACLFALLPRELLSLLFSRGEDVAVAAPLLRMLAPAAVLAAYSALAGVALNACGNMTAPVVATVAGAGLRMVLAGGLAGMPQIGIMAAPIATIACYGLTGVWNMVLLRRATGYALNFWQCVLLPLLCGLSAAVTGLAALRIVPETVAPRLGTLVALAAAVLVGLGLLWGTGLLSSEEETNEYYGRRENRYDSMGNQGTLRVRGSSAADDAASPTGGLSLGSGADPSVHPSQLCGGGVRGL